MAEEHSSLEDVLEICLDAIALQGWSVDDCLAHYPAYRQDLEPLLRVAAQFRQAQTLQPPPAFQEQAAARLRARLKSSRRPLPEPKPAARPQVKRQPFFAQRRFAFGFVALAAVLGLSAITTGTIYAAGNSLPGEPLYAVEQTVEQVQLTLTPADQKSTLALRLADKRLSEAEKLNQRGDSQHMQQALDDYDTLVTDAAQSVGDPDQVEDQAFLDTLNAKLTTHQARLQVLLATAPPAAQAGISKAIEASKHGQEKAKQSGKGHGKGQAEGTPQPTETDEVINTVTETLTPEAATDAPSNGQGGSSDKTCANGVALTGSTIGKAHQLANKYDVTFEYVRDLLCSGLTVGQVEAKLAAAQPTDTPKNNGNGKGKP